jgi:hypothetical protein
LAEVQSTPELWQLEISKVSCLVWIQWMFSYAAQALNIPCQLGEQKRLGSVASNSGKNSLSRTFLRGLARFHRCHAEVKVCVMSRPE